MQIVQGDNPARKTGPGAPWNGAQGMTSATVVVVDAAGTVVSVNPDFEHTAGYSRYEILGKPVAVLQDGDRDPLFFRLIDEAARFRRVGSEVLYCRRGNGPAGHESATVHPMCDAMGRVTGCVAIKYAVTSRGGVSIGSNGRDVGVAGEAMGGLHDSQAQDI